MIVLEKFNGVHFEQLKTEPTVSALLSHLTSAHVTALEETPFAYTILRDSRVLVCAGVSEYWPNRGEAWALLAANVGPDMVPVTKMVKRFLDVCPLRRIEAAVGVDHKAGHRWAHLLGFQLEAPLLRSYTPQGEDCALYSRVRRAG